VSISGPARIAQALVVPWFCCASMLAQISGTPGFRDYPATEVFTGTPAVPVLSTPEMKQYRTRIRNGVSTGTDVWIGSWKNPIKTKGPNFSGHYFVIRWGCGSQCMMMATVDAKTGVVYAPPLSGVGSELYVPLDNLSDGEVDLRPDSTLLVLRNACKNFKDRKSCGAYYFNWKNHHFDLVKFVQADPLKEPVRY
jgi:hypothetical protein